MLAWAFLSAPNKIRFFGPLSGVKKELLKALRGMAWDISHVRTLETMSTATNMGSFFIPFFVSFDERFSELIKLNQIQVLVIDDRLKRMHCLATGESDFQVKLNSCMSKKCRNEMTAEKSEIRRSFELPINDLKHILDNQSIVLERIAEDERKKRKAKA